jgi:uncharacterized metal-binding protein
LNCADCDEKDCYQGKDCTGMAPAVTEIYRVNPADMKISREATFIEGKYYMQYCRLRELIEFSRLMGYRRLGLAFCIGLSNEARMLQGILKTNGFEVSSVCCKVCGIMKEEFELQKIVGGRDEAMCNPIGQAEVLNREGVDLAIGVGLCVGHDVLFIKHCKAPFTPLVVKDRVLAHNPVGAIYSKYYRNILEGSGSGTNF